MQFKRKLTTNLLMTLMCLMTILLAACGNVIGISKSALNVPSPTPNGTPMAPDAQQIYHFPIVGPDLDIATFDPALTSDLYSSQAVSMVFVGMVRLDDKLQVQPELAQSWDQSSDGLQWTFHLRPNLTFSDGTPLTSADVAYSINRSLLPATMSQVTYYLDLLKDYDRVTSGKIPSLIGDSILTPDANTVVLKIVQKAAYFLQALTYPTSYVVEKSLIDKYGNQKFTDHLTEGGGAGPFKVAQYLHKQEIDFVPNPYYWNYKPRLQKVVFPFVASSDIAYQQYQNGQLDFTPVPADRIDEAKQSTSEYALTPILATEYFAMNFLAKPFDNLYIRQAFALSIQRETLNNTIFGGTQIPTYHIVPLGMVGYNPNLVGPANIKDSRGDFPVAQQRLQVGLQQEGWTNVSQMPPIKLTYPKSPTADRLMTAVTQMWQSVLGVSVSLDPVDFNTLLAELTKTTGNPHGLQMWYIGWIADYPDPQDWTTLQFDKGAAQNYMNYGQNNTADALPEQVVQRQLEQADAETNPATRVLLYNSAEQQLINQVAWLPLYQETSLTLQKPYVQGLVLNSLQITPPDDWANIYIAAH